MRRPDWTGRATALFQPWEKTVAIVAERPNTRRKRGRSAAFQLSAADVRIGRVEDGRGSLGHSATLRFPSPLIKPDEPISGIRLSDWLHREVHGEQTNRTRLRRGE